MTITPTYQTLTGKGDNQTDPGNCMVASVATTTGIALTDIPHFVAEYIEAGRRDIDSLDMGDWLTILANVISWLDAQGFDTAEVTEPTPGDNLFGAPASPMLAMVMSHLDQTAPHIIVVDQRWVQMWNPNPLDTTAYTPTDVIAALAVVKR